MLEGTRILTRADVRKLLSLEDCVAAVETAFAASCSRAGTKTGILGMHAQRGGFHVKAAFNAQCDLFAAKMNANFPANRQNFNLPTIQGVIVLCDANHGYPLAVMDSTEITILRTAAATAVAAKHLARSDSATLTICGCGTQAGAQVLAIAAVLPIQRVYAFDQDYDRARDFAARASSSPRFTIEAVRDLSAATLQSDVIVTCTPAKAFFLTTEHVKPGTFIGAVGADNEDKQELQPELLARSKVVADIASQAVTIGDSHHAVAAGLMSSADLYAELGQIASGQKPGRTSDDETTVFDSTGSALQDVAAAALVWRTAERLGAGAMVNFFN